MLLTAKFNGDTTSFEGATFSGKRTSLAGAEFCGMSGATVSFENPRAWNNVMFDWDDSKVEVPVCVRPRAWPPKVMAG